MVTISKPLSAGQAQAYHANEFTSAEQNYYTHGNQIRGEWQGRLAEAWNLRGEVSEEAFSRLAAGQHPETPGGHTEGNEQNRRRPGSLQDQPPDCAIVFSGHLFPAEGSSCLAQGADRKPRCDFSHHSGISYEMAGLSGCRSVF